MDPADITPALRAAMQGEVDESSRRRAEYSSDASNYRVVPQVVAFPRDVGDLPLENTLLEMLSGLERQQGREADTAAARAGRGVTEPGTQLRGTEDAIGQAKVLLSLGRLEQAREAF